MQQGATKGQQITKGLAGSLLRFDAFVQMSDTCFLGTCSHSVVLGYGSRWGVWDFRSPASLSASYGATTGTSVADVAAVWEAGLVLSATLDGCVRVRSALVVHTHL
jgi:hypothetical protein